MTTTDTTRSSGVGTTVRRLIVFILLFTLVSFAAAGVSGLLGRLFEIGSTVADGDNYGLASSLAFTLIAGPFAAVLWWLEWRLLKDPSERDAGLWGFYVAAMSTVALVVGVLAVCTTISSLVAGSDGVASSSALAIVWLLVWFWHRWMSRHPHKSPTRLVGGARILGYAFGIMLAVGGFVAVISTVVVTAVQPATGEPTFGQAWWITAVQALVWAVIGAAVWFLHWIIDGGSQLRTGFARVMVVLVTGLLAVGLTLGGLAGMLYVVLRIFFSSGVPLSEVLDPLGPSMGLAAVGALLWAYYRGQVRRLSPVTALGTRLVSSGVALAITASGVGILINAILAELASNVTVYESDSRALLATGLSALLVGGPAWWLIWKPLAPVTPELVRDTGRKVYLIAFFGISALVALITLLVIGYQIFVFALATEPGSSLLDSVRGALGLLVATVLVASYHFSVWRGDRARVPAEQRVTPTISRVVLVAGAHSDEAVETVRTVTGAAVTVFTRTDSAPTADAGELAAALDGVTGARVLVIAELGGVRVIPLEN